MQMYQYCNTFNENHLYIWKIAVICAVPKSIINKLKTIMYEIHNIILCQIHNKLNNILDYNTITQNAVSCQFQFQLHQCII